MLLIDKKLNNINVFLIVLVLLLIVFSRTLYFDFTFFDDTVLVLTSTFKDIFAFFGRIVLPDTQIPYYRPLLSAVYSAVSFTRDNFGLYFYHIQNMLIHAAVCVLMFRLLLKLGIKQYFSLVAVLFFAVHPVSSICVSWIPGLNDSMLALFVISGFISLMNYTQSFKPKYLAAYLLFLTLALFTKETAVMLPVISFLYIYFFAKEHFNLKKCASLAALNIVLTAIWFFVRQIVVLDNSINLSETLKSIIYLPVMLGHYLFPADIFFLSFAGNEYQYGYLLLSVIFVYLAYVFTNNKKKFWFGIIWFLLFIFPTLMVSAYAQNSLMDQRLYLPAFGLILIITTIIQENFIVFSKKLAVSLCLVYFLFFAFNAYAYSFNFKNGDTLWNYVLSENTVKRYFMYSYAGDYYYANHLINSAIRYYEEALLLNPGDAELYGKIGFCFMRQKKHHQAKQYIESSLSINPKDKLMIEAAEFLKNFD